MCSRDDAHWCAHDGQQPLSIYYHDGHPRNESKNLPIALLALFFVILFAMGLYLYSQATACRMSRAMSRPRVRM